MEKEPRLGIDFGRVIHGGPLAPGDADTVFLGGSFEEALASPATEGVYEVLPGLIAAFGGRAWIISKCGDRIQRRTLAWLDHHDFYGRIGLPRGNVRFCRKRADKAWHCEELGITHMIDDRLDVHRAIRGIVPYRYLFGPQEGPGWVRRIGDWAEAASISEDIPAGRTRPATPRSR
ncbi:hypothetical protein [Actinomadura rubrisoli]|uniref:Uncharacterized protein n=1 Tax=Actinomadura rubrisoli TaxID=2530368 RepID=A0A4R5AJR9_9ACTN|nr:hypothetical protein [Actinomadura rubrisoli]TDD70332.1 hypothetical protein E1298_36735 [Actinomadura rubrisoli]